MARRKRNQDDTPIAELILAAAAQLFGRQGYEKTSVKTIAHQAGITGAALYYHYANKQEVIFRVLERTVEQLLAACAEAIVDPTLDPVEATRHFVVAHVMCELTELAPFTSLYATLGFGMRQQEDLLTAEQWAKLRALESQHFDSLKSIIRRGMDTQQFHTRSATMTSFGIFGMMNHVFNWANPSGRIKPQDIARFVASQAVSMARSEREGVLAA